MPAKQTGRKTGFTLIELLVVIAIIAILAAILFPVFARARENARRASCMSNEKQIGLGIFQYSQDYDEKLPMGAHDQAPSVAGGGPTASLAQDLQPYMKSTQIFVCPSLSNIASTLRHGSDNVDYSACYGTNSMFMGYNTSQALAAINSTATTIFVAEKDGADWIAWPSVPIAASATYTDNGGAANADFRAKPRHLEGGNFLFGDGHVKWLKTGRDAAPDNLWDNAS